MKHANRLLALLLVLAMMLSLTSFAFAKAPETNPGSTPKKLGFRDPQFQLSNSYHYANDESVRAIVLLDGAPEAEVAAVNSQAAAAHRETLTAQHQAVKAQMQNFTPACEFTSLLNGFSVDVPYGELDAISRIPGVASVHVANRYAVPSQPDTKALVSGVYTGNTASAMAGFDGSGMVIAVLDTGLNTTHEAFQDAGGLCASSAALTRDNLLDAAAPGAYLSPKVPFAYDYADHDADVTDHQGHGTHVSGIAAGYAVKDDAVVFRGAAPAAQILSMKVFHDNEPGTSSDIFFAALEDAYRLGADVINMSLGAQNGFTFDSSLEEELYGNIYLRLDRAGVILSISAGNEGSMADNAAHGFIGPEYTDYGTVGTPSTYEGNLSVAAMENAMFPAFTLSVDGTACTYMDSSISPEDWEGIWIRTYGGRELPFAVVKTADGQIAAGAPEDYASNDVAGKVAVVQRGVITFQEKVTNAAAAGAVGLVVCNNQPGPLGMKIDDFAVPTVSVDVSMQDIFLNAKVQTLVVENHKFEINNPQAFRMGSFSGWGTSPDLTIDPTLTSFGGNIYSAFIGGDQAYDVLSGTSMSAPFLAGTIANVLTYLESIGFDGTKAQRASAAEALLESSAIIIPDGENPYAVRRQGAGLADAMAAIDNYENVGYITNPLQELGDDPEQTGVYSFELNLKNTTDKAVRYNDFSSIALMDSITSSEVGLKNELYSSSISHTTRYTLNGQEVTELTVPAGETVAVTVEITLSEESRNHLEFFPNGTFVEGFVTFTANGTYKNHATYLAYYGDWTAAPVAEGADFRDFLDAAYQLTQIPGDDQGNSLADLGMTPLDVLNIYTIPNMAFTYSSAADEPVYFPGGNMMSDVPFNPEYVSFSTGESLEALSDALAIQPSLLRNASEMKLTVTDVNTGDVLYEEQDTYWPKSAYRFDAGAWLPYGYFIWDGMGADGNYIPSGTKVHVALNAVLPYGSTAKDDIWSFDITVDSISPTIGRADVVLDSAAGTLTVTAADERYLQSILLQDPKTYDLVGAEVFAPQKPGERCTAVFDIQPLLLSGMDSVNIMALDYATNLKVARVPLYNYGEDATITLVSPVSQPVSSQESVGYKFTFPQCTDVIEGAEFDSWTVVPVDTLSPEQYETLPKFYPGERITVTGNAAYYALYAVGDELPLDQPVYYRGADNGDYSGTYAVVGFDPQFVVGKPYDTDHPKALNQNLETISVAELADAMVSPSEVAFTTGEAGLKFVLSEAADYYTTCYTIQNAENGKYLALDETNQLIFTETADDSAYWRINSRDIPQASVTISSCGSYDTVLVYNPETMKLEAMDKWTVVGEDDMGWEIYVQDAYGAWLMTYAESQFAVDSYTTNPGSAVHSCKWDDGVVTKAATCTEDGVLTYTCVVCGKTRTEVIPAAHSWDDGVVQAAPTCTSEGSILYTCTECGETRTEVLPALPHNWDNGKITVEPSCCKEGVKTYTCQDCGATKEITLPSLGGHHFDNGTVTKTPTYTEEGEMIYTCLVCGETKTEVIPALGPVTGPCYWEKFVDCTDEWYHEAVDYMVSKDLMKGIGDDRFDPTGVMTRAMMVTVLYRANGCPEVGSPSTFTDVPADEWYSDAVAWVQENSIVLGVTEGKFAPDAPVTREQLAAILWRFEKSPLVDSDLSGFVDADEVSDYARNAMRWAVADGLLLGNHLQELNPADPATRAEFAVIMLRFLNGAYACEN